MKISRFATDLDLEESGVWIDIGDGAQLKIARVGNPNYQKVIRRLRAPYRAQIRNKTLHEDLQDDLVIKAFAEAILLDWKGLEDDNGKAIKYSQENAYQLMKDLKDFRALVGEIALEGEAFRRAEEEAEGKSSKSS